MKTKIVWLLCILSIHQITGKEHQKALIIGASTGIGREVAKELARHGYDLGICSRKIDLLNTLKKELPTRICVRQLDLRETEKIHSVLQELVEEMGGMDIIIVNSGIWPESQQGMMPSNQQTPFALIRETIDVNVTGCTATFNFAHNYFVKQQRGHIVGISSVDAVRGIAINPSYGASKAFMAHYLEGMRNKYIQLGIPITVTEVRPGWIQTTVEPETDANAYWVVPSSVAAHDIYAAIIAKTKVAYVPKRWALIGFLLQITPDWLYNKMGGF